MLIIGLDHCEGIVACRALPSGLGVNVLHVCIALPGDLRRIDPRAKYCSTNIFLLYSGY